MGVEDKVQETWGIEGKKKKVVFRKKGKTYRGYKCVGVEPGLV